MSSGYHNSSLPLSSLNCPLRRSVGGEVIWCTNCILNTIPVYKSCKYLTVLLSDTGALAVDFCCSWRSMYDLTTHPSSIPRHQTYPLANLLMCVTHARDNLFSPLFGMTTLQPHRTH